MDDKVSDKTLDDALSEWPEIGGHADETAAAKTMNKIRANFPPKSKLSISDDALVAAPLPATAEEWGEEKAAAEEKSSRIDVPIGRASSIPPPSSGVSRSEKTAADDPPAKMEAGMGQVERQRERTSFKDLAKLAATPPPSSVNPSSAKVPIPAPSSSSGDSGVVDLQAAALSDPQAAERAKSTPLASGSLFDEEGPQSRQSAPPPSMSGAHSAAGPLSAVQSVPQQIDPYSPASVRPSAPPSLGSTLASAGPHSAVAALNAQKKVEEKKSSPVLAILGSLVAASAIAAGALLFVKMHHKAAPVAASQPVAQAAAQDNAAQPATPDQPTANDTTPQVVAQNDVQNTAPVAQGAVAKSGKPVAHAAGVKPSASKSGGGGNALADAMEKDTASTPPATPPQAATNDTPPPSGSSADLQNAMKTAVGPSDSSGGDKAAPSGPKFAPGSVPQRPSQGALASAIGRVLPDARSCLGPDDGVSYATIVFESGGSTQNVTLSGFAANKPAGACITTALKKANVGPFAESTYTAKVTVRP